jgi:hypothetical protein
VTADGRAIIDRGAWNWGLPLLVFLIGALLSLLSVRVLGGMLLSDNDPAA